ncbi:hypothetical protein AVDCRST_MAG81-3499 [uncultured Synechococcales cyanobacterium]|uniref:Uncharacterized protein n=1 Tax=uncultured Synechococcales cyanobacterium TaxID=1936017 RepID=A0A6J4VPN7_9CYAN|nr:hypothetical protein AVDCRST_MAG81-3499 [uncultured Synechococcales cyanobacterium]
MSYSSIIEGLPEPLRHPSRLAIIASMAFHGVAFAVLPFLPTPSTAVNTQRMVNLIELSAAEQNRLPQVSASQLPQTGSASGGLPPLGLGTLPPGLPNYSVDSPIAFDPSIPRALPEFNAPVVIPLPTRPSQPPPDPDPSAAPLPGNQALEVPQSNSNVPPFDPNQLPGVAPANPAIPPGPSPEPFFPLPDPGTTEGSIASVPIPSPSSQPPTPLPARPGSESQPPAPLPARPGSESQPPAPLPAGPGSEWLVEARRVSGDPALTIQTQAVTLPYPEKLCNSPLKGPVPVQVLALVNPTGKLVALSGSIGGLRLLESTGYPTLNNVALDPANYPIRATGQYQAIWYSSEFTYSGKDCAATELGSPAKKSPSTTDPSPSPSDPSPSPSDPSPSPKNLSPSPTPTPTTPTSSPTSPSLAPETLEVTPSPSPNTPTLNQISPLPEASEAPLAPTPEKPEAAPSPPLETPQVAPAPSPEAATPQAPAPEPSSPSPTN